MTPRLWTILKSAKSFLRFQEKLRWSTKRIWRKVETVGWNQARNCNLSQIFFVRLKNFTFHRLHPDSKFEYRECFDITRKKTIYPTDIPNFQLTNASLQFYCQNLIKNLLKLLALSLKLNDSDYFINCCRHLDIPETDNECDFSMIHYPPILSDTVLPPDTVRCAEHTDYEILTLLFQNEVEGLEVNICFYHHRCGLLNSTF